MGPNQGGDVNPIPVNFRMMKITGLILLACALFVSPTESAAQSESQDASQSSAAITIEDIAIGFGRDSAGGHYKVGLWTPVNVQLRGSSQPITGVLELESIDGDGFASLVESAPITIAAGATIQSQLLVRPGSQGGTITVRFRSSDDRAIIAERKADLGAMLSSQQLWVEVGANLRTGDANRAQDLNETDAIEVARVEDLSDLPTKWFGYESVDVLFLSPADESLRDNFRNNSRLTALENWVKAGGRLVLLVGTETAEQVEFFAGGADSHPLARFVPGTFERMAVVPQSAELQRYAGTSDRFAIDATFRMPAIEANPTALVRAELQNGTPFVVDSAFGLGRVTFVALDWHRPPFLTWTARDQFINATLGIATASANNEADETGGQLTHAGITDMSSQLRSGLDQFPEVSIFPFWAIALAIVGYIALIGPIDYFLVKRLFRRDGHSRMELTWITFPIWVILVSGIAYWIAADTKGSNLHVNQLIVEDHDLQSGIVRNSAWFSVFSPSMEAFDIQLKDAAASNETTMVSWMGLPGQVLGGMATDNPLGLGGAGAYRYAGGYDQLQSTPIPVWSSRTFASRWLTEDSEAPLEVNIRILAGDPSGTIRNTSGHDLTNCIFAYRRWGYLVKEWPNGATINFSNSAQAERRELRAELNGRRKVMNTETQQLESKQEEYDVLGRDLNSIARMMSLYESAGGKDYTHLDHRYQAFMDLTPQIELRRGVLIGFVEESEPVVQVSPQQADLAPRETTWKCLRFVFDVE